MFDLLNRIGWVLSLVVGVVIVNMIGLQERYIWESFGWILLLIIVPVVKRFFFGKKFIKNSLQAASMKKRGESGVEIGSSIKDSKVITKKINTVHGRYILSNNKGDIVEREEMASKSNKHEDMPLSPVLKTEPNKFISYLKEFFSTNLLAKVGGLLVFAGVIFLLQLIYTKIGPVGKISIGFGIGLISYIAGVILDKKGYLTESRSLFFAAIAINYAVILSGRFLLDGVYGNIAFLSDSLTFVLLILNTIFAVITALVYKSKTLLYLGYIIAFINPFIIGATASENPYILAGYGLIVALGAWFNAYWYRNSTDINSKKIILISSIGISVLSLVAPFSDNIGWVYKLAVLILGLGANTYLAYREKWSKEIIWNFILAYFVFFLMLPVNKSYGQVYLPEMFSYFVSMFLVLFSFAFILLKRVVELGIYIILLPIVLFLYLIFGDIILPFGGVVLIALVMLSYLLIFFLLKKDIYGEKKSNIFFMILGIFISLATVGQWGKVSLELMDSWLVYIIFIIPIIFQFASYYFSTKNSLNKLYLIGTVAGIISLLPLIIHKGEWIVLSAISVSIFVILNLGRVLWGRISFDWSNLLAVAIGAIFASWELWLFGKEYFSGVSLGLAYLVLAIIYFFIGFKISKNIVEGTDGEKIVNGNKNNVNFIYSFIGISISLFTLSIGMIFADNAMVKVMVWTVEGAVLLYLNSKIKDIRILVAGVLVSLISLYAWWSFWLESLRNSLMGNWIGYTLFAFLVFLAVLYSLKFINVIYDEKGGFWKIIYYLIHIISLTSIMALGSALIDINMGNSGAWSRIILFSAIYIMIVFGWYRYIEIKSKFMKFVMVVVGLILFVSTIIWNSYNLGDILFSRITAEHLILLVAIIPSLVALKIPSGIKGKFSGGWNILFYLSLFIISSQFVFYLFFKSFFVVTIYWALLAFGFIGYGIEGEKIKFRTVGLYILILTFGKIVLYDIWWEVDGAGARVVSLIAVGILTIAISMLYNRKIKTGLKGELSLKNFSNNN